MDQTFEMRCTCPPTRWEKGAAEHDPGCPLGDFIAGKFNPQARPESAIDELAPELLAQLFHETREHLAVGFDCPRHFLPEWKHLPDNERLLLVATCKAVLAEIDRRAMLEPMGMLVSKLSDGQIRVDFSKKLKRFEMKREHAIDYAIAILNQCGVALEIKTILPPAPGEPG